MVRGVRCSWHGEKVRLLSLSACEHIRLELLASLGQVCVSDNIQAAFRKRKWDQCVERLLEAFDGNDLSESEAEEGDCKDPAAVDSGESSSWRQRSRRFMVGRRRPIWAFTRIRLAKSRRRRSPRSTRSRLRCSLAGALPKAGMVLQASNGPSEVAGVRTSADVSPTDLTDLGTHEKRVKAVIMHLEGVLKELRL